MADFELRALEPDPREEWARLLRFVEWSAADRLAASATVEPLFRAGPKLVADAYDHLARVPETAAVLGWEDRIDERHLEERRRFFTVWLARTLGLDTSDEFALYLFQAGVYHAGRGPRAIRVPPEYVTGSVGLVLNGFAATLGGAGLSGDVASAALGAWSKYLTVQLDLMLLGYRVATDLAKGPVEVECELFGRMRSAIGSDRLAIHVEPDGQVADVLRKLFNYRPQARDLALERSWYVEDDPGRLWDEVAPAFTPRPGWRVLLNGRDLSYDGGVQAAVKPGDRVSVFPPGR